MLGLRVVVVSRLFRSLRHRIFSCVCCWFLSVLNRNVQVIGSIINCTHYWMDYTLFVRLLTSISIGIKAIATILIVVSLVGMFINCIIVYNLVCYVVCHTI